MNGAPHLETGAEVGSPGSSPADDVPVSVLMPVYNGGAYLAEAIDSVRRQTHGNFELIVIDDGSTDGSPAILARMAELDKRIRYVRQENKGMAAALNHGLALARNEIVARMDADDRMLPTRLQRQLALLLERPDIAVLTSLVYYINAKGRRFGYSNEIIEPAAARDVVREGNLIGFSHPAVMMRKSSVDEVGGYRGRFWPAEDIDLWIRLIERGWGILTHPEHLLEYRIHRASVCVAEAKRVVRKTDWVHACMLARRAGRAEPTWAEYCADLGGPLSFRRMSAIRAELAAIAFKHGVFLLSVNKPVRAAITFMVPALLRPSYVMWKIVRKRPMLWRRPRDVEPSALRPTPRPKPLSPP